MGGYDSCELCVKCEGLLSVKWEVSKRKLLENAVRTNFGSSIMRKVGVGDSGYLYEYK